ncbi:MULTISPECIES: TIGR03915 family putative DNA repair protein [unclassified Adlercreutzia]|uniref:TIGR03915 family putative DNA repair protein n=1 Tax=unclassified Adlercreutzia TaxID=2636013 RepID=UPI0013E9C3BD|nr:MULTISPECIES: TIGR03915 family putative DNA repair protein [unclassified Adlercreutzia]
MPAQPEVYDEVAYVYDGTLEGLLSAIFAAYANREDPSDVMREGVMQPRLSQRVSRIETDVAHADRVRRGLCRACGHQAFSAVKKAALSAREDAGTAAYRFVRYAMDSQKKRDCARCRKRATCSGAQGRGPCPKQRGRALSDVTHPAVEPLFRIARAVDQECEHMRQFIRFEHLTSDEADVWFARCNPRDSVIPLVMGHFVERFSVQPFIIYDENHHLAGVFDGSTWYLVRTDDPATSLLELPGHAADEAAMQQAWKRFYRTVAVESRYNPELRRHFMPKRFWRNLTEMQEDSQALVVKTRS